MERLSLPAFNLNKPMQYMRNNSAHKSQKRSSNGERRNKLLITSMINFETCRFHNEAKLISVVRKKADLLSDKIDFENLRRRE